MVYNYNEIIEIYNNWHGLEKALERKEVYKLDSGLYSFSEHVKELDIVVKRFNNPIFTLQSAFYYYGISDVIPDKYYISSNKNGTKYKKTFIKQVYMCGDILFLGLTSIDYLGTRISIYSKERLLIELIRYKHNLPYDYYKEIINYYRRSIGEINIQEVIDMANIFPKKELILRTIQEEVL